VGGLGLGGWGGGVFWGCGWGSGGVVGVSLVVGVLGPVHSSLSLPLASPSRTSLKFTENRDSL